MIIRDPLIEYETPHDPEMVKLMLESVQVETQDQPEPEEPTEVQAHVQHVLRNGWKPKP